MLSGVCRTFGRTDREEGREEGRSEGLDLAGEVLELAQKGMDAEHIAQTLAVDPVKVRSLLERLKRFAK